MRLVVLTGVLSTLITNDVSLIVVVPLTLALDIEGGEKVIILETIAANGVSALTPFGNPQNLFIYYHFGLQAGEFVGAIPFPYALVRDRAALRVDYFLLFFGFTDNLRPELQGPTSVFVYSALASQVISNVPSTLLLADFTSNWRALLWGVSVGASARCSAPWPVLSDTSST